MFGIVREIQPPGVVQNCCSARFSKPDVDQLVLGKSRVLEVYDIVEEGENSSLRRRNGYSGGTASASPGLALRLECRYELFGTIESLNTVRSSALAEKTIYSNGALTSSAVAQKRQNSDYDSRCDLLLLTFGTGRASIVGYSFELGPYILRNIALFNFEPDALGSNLRSDANNFQTPYGFGSSAVAEVDPLARCAAIPLNGSLIAVIPFDCLRENISTQNGLSSDVLDEVALEKLEETHFKQAKVVRRVAISMSADQVWEMHAGCYLIDLVKLGGIPCGSLIHMAFLQMQSGVPVLGLLHYGWIRAGTCRAAIARWTVHLTAICVSQHSVNVVWRTTKLPSDSFALVPTSGGGALVLSQNCIHYIVNGSVNCSISLNGFAQISANLEAHDSKSPTEFNLGGAHWTWLDDTHLILILRYGQVILLEVNLMELRLSIRGRTVQATCMCTLGPNSLFVGSRLADSVLVKWSIAKADELIKEEVSSIFPESLEIGDYAKRSVATINEEDRFLYGADFISQSNKSSKKQDALLLRVIDALPCTGPIGDIACCDAPKDELEEERVSQAAQELQNQGLHSAAARLLRMARDRTLSQRQPKEIVAGAGRARDGGVRVFFPALRLNTGSDCIDQVEVISPPQSLFVLQSSVNGVPASMIFTEAMGLNGLQIHTFADQKKSMLKADSSSAGIPGGKFQPVDFESVLQNFSEATTATVLVHAFKKYVLHVCLDKICVRNSESSFDVVSSTNIAVRFAVAHESLVLVCTRAKQAQLFCIDLNSGELELEHDFKGADASAPMVTGAFFKQGAETYCAIVRAGLQELGAGALEVYNLSTNSIIFRSDHALALGCNVLRHRPENEPLESDQGMLAKLKVSNLCVGPVGRLDPDPHCSAHMVQPRLCVCISLAHGDVFVYRVSDERWSSLWRVQLEVVTRIDRNILKGARQFASGNAALTGLEKNESVVEDVDEQLQDSANDEDLKLKRSHSSAFEGNSPRVDEEDKQLADEDFQAHKDTYAQGGWKAGGHRTRITSRLIPFDSLGGFCGVLYVCGSGASVAIIGSRGSVCAVRLDFGLYNIWNVAVSLGRLFVLGTSKSQVMAPGSRGGSNDTTARVFAFEGFRLMRYLRVDGGGPLPFLHIPLRASVTKIAYDSSIRGFLLICFEDDASEEEVLAVRAKCSIRLLCADKWQVVDQYSLMRHEQALAVANVKIDMMGRGEHSTYTHLGGSATGGNIRMEDFFAIGTGFIGPDGEDAGCKGRVLVFKLSIDPSSNEKRITSRYKIESKHIRGPVSAIASVDGLLLATFGSTPCALRIFYFDPSTEEFITRSFIDTPFSATSIAVVKNYIVVGDLYKSVQLLHWHNTRREFRVIAKDPSDVQVNSCTVIQHDKKLGLVSTDTNGNLLLLEYNPEKPTLQYRGEINLGEASTAIKHYVSGCSKSINLFGTLDGGLGGFVPLAEQTFRRLFALQAAMSSSLYVHRNAGLHPRAYRASRFDFPLQRQRQRNIADGKLLFSFINLDAIAQRSLARKVGTTTETLFEDFRLLDHIIFFTVL